MAKVDKASYLAKYAPYAQAEQARTGIPASVILAQMIQEGGWNPSELATKYNNFFGVKAFNSWKGNKVRMHDYKEGSYDYYRVYDNLQHSIEDHTKVLMNSRYAKARAQSDPYKMVDEIAKAGYAADPKAYSAALQNLIHSNNLTQYDTGAKGTFTGGSSTSKPTTPTTSTGSSSGTIIPSGSTTTTTIGDSDEFGFNAPTIVWGGVGILLVGLGVFIAFNPGLSAINNVGQAMNAIGKTAQKATKSSGKKAVAK